MSAPRIVSRRVFLRDAGVALGVGVAGIGGLTGCGEASAEATSADWNTLARLLPGRVLQPGAAGFDEIATPWNLRWSSRPRPEGIVRAASVEDVRTALLWARDNRVPLVARSGGHSYAAYSTTPGLIIDVSTMSTVRYDPGSERAFVDAGARNSDVYTALGGVGRIVTHGRCLGVGVAGLVLGGGIGFNMRRIGLTCDQLVETDIVTADGELLKCNAAENTDLFWAARGAGGGNFGIHTSFTFETHPAPRLTVFDLVWLTRQEDVLRALLDVLHAAPNELGVKVSVTAKPVADRAPEIAVKLLGQYAGTRAAFEALLAPVYAIARPELPGADLIEETDYWSGQSRLSERGDREFAYERSRYVMKPLSDTAIGVIFAHLRAWPATGVGAMWKGFLTGGAIRNVAPDATAFVHRRDWLLSGTEVNWVASDAPAQVQRSMAWMDGFHAAMRPYTSDECYQNFIDDGETDWPRAYYGENLERLVRIKRAFDPRNVFQYAQSVPLSI